MKSAAVASFDTSFASRLAKLDLSPIISQVAAETGLAADDLARAEDMYRKFLTLHALYPQQQFVPPRIADVVWHTHITNTRKYMADCEVLFGEYFHHTPGLADAEGEFTAHTLPAMKKEFGVDLRAHGMEQRLYAAADCH